MKLLFPPLKQPKITDRIVFPYKKNGPNIFYRMVDINSGEIVGEMKARPEVVSDKFFRFSPNAESYRSFYIERLRAFVKNQGVGKTFIKIAQKESSRNFCSGNVHLVSYNTTNPKEVPHMFYRKLGFEFNKYCKNTQQYIDECIKMNIRPFANRQCRSECPMYLEKCVNGQEEEIKNTYNLKIKFPWLF